MPHSSAPRGAAAPPLSHRLTAPLRAVLWNRAAGLAVPPLLGAAMAAWSLARAGLAPAALAENASRAAGLVALLAGVFSAFLWFGVWSWRRLMGPLRDSLPHRLAPLELYARTSVVRWGLGCWLAFAVASAAAKMRLDAGALAAAGDFAHELALRLTVGLGLCLWGGYYLGLTFGRMRGLR
jgi:hypothetical protein